MRINAIALRIVNKANIEEGEVYLDTMNSG